jgi:FHS family L-fucose permease-like MFS transporter
MSSSKKSASAPFITLVVVFFFWGFVAASNDILIPVFKSALNLSQLESQMISFAFYVAYTVGSLLYFFISKIKGGDILNSLGYRNGLALGLTISAAGTLLFIPAANTGSFELLISGLFIVGLGFSLQQTAANPLAISMGDPSKGSQRLSLAGGINNVGTTIGPVIVSFAIFGSASSGNTTMDLKSVQIPYLVLGAAFLLAAVLFKLSSVPDKIESTFDASKDDGKTSPLQYPQLVLGMIAIFLYVGVEVSTASNLPEFMKQTLGMESNSVAPYISLFWGSLMIGRWTSAAGAFDISARTKNLLNLILLFIAFGIFLLVNFIGGSDVSVFYMYIAMVALLIVVDKLCGGKPAKQLLIYSFCAIVALMTGIFSTGMTSVYAFVSVGLFCSTLWPCIFTLAITGLGRHTNEGSSFLIMMIMGGGIISMLQGYLADNFLGIQQSYWVGIVCFVYLAFYAWKTRHLDAATTAGAGH